MKVLNVIVGLRPRVVSELVWDVRGLCRFQVEYPLACGPEGKMS